MPLSYDRKFTIGRGSELLYNEDLHYNYEAIRHILDTPKGKDATPTAKLDGALWLDKKKNELNTYVKPSNTWKNVFAEKFQIVDQITNELPPDHPVLGQLWIYNDVLMYYDGANWKPVKALEQDGSQFNLSVFENFSLVSPLWRIGNTILEDKLIYEFEDKERKYLQAKLDYAADSDMKGENKKWEYGHHCNIDDITLSSIIPDGKAQLLVPNIDVDRVFIDNDLNHAYDAPTKVCIEYPRKFLLHKTPSLVHVNPGRLTKITKRLVKIDRDNPLIKISAHNTEFYGFHGGDVHGDFLRPTAIVEEGYHPPRYDENGRLVIEKNDKVRREQDYEVMSNGIYLSYNASQHYDYILAISYEFSWFKSTGKLNHISNQSDSTTFYIQDYLGPMNVFVDGYNLEDPEYEEDNMSQVITVKHDVTKNEIGMMNTPFREYGFIRQIDLSYRGVIKTLREYKQPLVFVNGEAMSPTSLEFDGNYIYVAGTRLNMVWSVVDLYDNEKGAPMWFQYGIVNKTDADGNPAIEYDPSIVKNENSLIVFIDGLLVKKEDVKRKGVDGTLTVPSLKAGQEYIIIDDPTHRLYDETKIQPALPVGHLSESLVYLNGKLICNDTAVVTTESVEQLSEPAYAEKNTQGEVRFFVWSDLDHAAGEYRIWDEIEQVWKVLPAENVAEVESFVHSYENSVRAIKYNIPVSSDDDIQIYAFNYANAIEHPLIIRNIPYDFQEYDKTYSEWMKALEDGNDEAEVAARMKLDLARTERKDFKIKENYIPNIGSLSVWVNGVRQYDVIEWATGDGFSLPARTAGIVTYVIENPEKGATQVAQRDVLTYKNIVPNTVNVYRTGMPLYPGRVKLYIDGVRQPQDAYTILDNYTLLINDKKVMLIGSKNNYPDEPFIEEDGSVSTIHHTAADRILVEVTQDFDRQENHIYLDDKTSYEVSIEKYDLPIDMLEASDEIMIFVNGLFFGMRNLIGYMKDRYRGCIRLLDSDIVSRITSDPLYTYLKSNPKDMRLYKSTHDGKEYKPRTKEMLFDWR